MATETHILLDHHAEILTAAAISPEVIAARGYRSVTTKAELSRLGFGARQQITPTLLLPVWNVHGENGLYTHRPDTPRLNDRGKTIKYEFPRGARMQLDVPPCVRPYLGDPGGPCSSRKA
jgi:putative DNA primase/helicase